MNAPPTGGSKISQQVYEELCKQVDAFASTRPWYPDIQLKARIKGQFCYIDTVEQRDDGERVFPLCRLRRLNWGWSMALFTWSNERYEPCIFPNGQWEGGIEGVLSICDPMVI